MIDSSRTGNNPLSRIPVKCNWVRILFNASLLMSQVNWLRRVNISEFALNFLHPSPQTVNFDVRNWWKNRLLPVFLRHHVPLAAQHINTLVFSLLLQCYGLFLQSDGTTCGKVISFLISKNKGFWRTIIIFVLIRLSEFERFGNNFSLDIRSKQVKYLLVIIFFKSILVKWFIKVKVEIQKVFRTIVFIHSYVLKGKCDVDKTFCKVLSKLYELSAKTLDELFIDIWDPSLHSYRNILIQKMHTFLLL